MTQKYRLWAKCLKLIAMALLTPMAAGVQAATHQQDDAFPYDLAFTSNEFPYNSTPVSDPAGNRVAYVVIAPPSDQPQNDRFLPNGTPTTVMGSSLHIVSASAKSANAATSICGGKGNQWSPAWSPNGKQLAFYSDSAGPVQLWTYSLDSQTCQRVSDAVIRASVFTGSEPRWSPDGLTLYVPLDPKPPGLDSQQPAVNASTPALAQAKLPPQVHFGGSEQGGTGSEQTKSGSSQALMMRFYNTTLAAIDLKSGQVRTLVAAEDETRPNRMDLSPSGKWVSYMSVIYPEQEISTSYVMDLFAVRASQGKPQPIVKGLPSSEHGVNYTRLDYRWHPVEDQLFYLKAGALWSVTFGEDKAQSPVRIAAELGELAPAVLYFTADGKHLLVGTSPKGIGRDRAPQGLALVPLAGGSLKRLALPLDTDWQFLDLIRANENVLWQPDTRSLSVVMREKRTGQQVVQRFQIESGARATLANGMYRTTGFTSGGDHKHLVAIYEDIATPPNLYSFSSNVSRGQRLSIIDQRLEGRRYGSAEVIETRTPRYDGSIGSVRTTLLLPPGAKKGDKLPGIVMIYSGSDLSTRASYFGGGMGNTVPSQVFTSRGYAVIMANIVLSPEGTPSHPAEQMTDEVLAQAYAVAEAGYVDINRLAVSGQSYGGYSTASIVSHTKLFRAGIPVNGSFDLASFYGGMDDSGNSHWIRWAEKGQGRMGEHPWINPERYIDNSPYYRVDRIDTPLLIVAGEKDSTVPYEESKKLFVGLRRLERPVQLAIYPGEGHVIATWSKVNAVDVSKRMIDFLDKHLGKPRPN